MVAGFEPARISYGMCAHAETTGALTRCFALYLAELHRRGGRLDPRDNQLVYLRAGYSRALRIQSACVMAQPFTSLGWTNLMNYCPLFNLH